MCNICVYLVNPMRTTKTGRFVGDWLSLPFSDEERDEVFCQLGSPNEYKDFFITHAETENLDIDIDYTTDLTELNELAKKIDALSCEDDYKLAAYLEWVPHLTLAEISAVIDRLDNYDFLSDVYDGKDFEQYCIREFGSMDALPGKISKYSDLFKHDNGISYCLDMYYSSLGVIIRTS